MQARNFNAQNVVGQSGVPGTQTKKSTDDTSQRSQNIDEIPAKEEEAPPLRRIEQQFGRENLANVLSPPDVDLYDEFLEPSDTRFSKTKIFIDYKEFHNRRNIQELDRSADKKYFKKQLRVVNKDKQIDKRMPCWASSTDLIRKVQIIQNKLIASGLLKDALEFEDTQAKRDFLKPKVQALCGLMEREFEINMKKLKKAREEQKRAQLAKLQADSARPPQQPKMSRAQQLAQGYTFMNPKVNKHF